MSQEKVNKYKEQKANRKKNIKKEKIQNMARKCVVAFVALILVGWVGYSAYGMYKTNKPKDSVEIDYAPFNDYFEGLAQAQQEQKAE